MALPVLDTRQVLLDHLLAKLTSLCSTKLAAKKILLEISNNLPNKDILELLQNEKNLENTVKKFYIKTLDKEDLGEKLYYKIEEIEPELCSKITGMLMELDTNTIKKLLTDEELLQKAIDKSKKEYLEFTSNTKKREEFGDQLYTLVSERHKPEIASHLTGMLLELDETSIRKLLTNPKEFEKKLEIAYNTMSAHQELGDFIKRVHIDLRLRSRDIGPSAAWDEHSANHEKLEKYAMAMQELASVHWEKNNGANSELSRIFWVIKKIDWYFDNNGRIEFLDKENKLAQKFCIDYVPEETFPVQTVSLLDVGSCYNPFSKFPNLDVTSIDLVPANGSVLKCDFLSVAVGDRLLVDADNMCRELPKESYDAVLFSLLLEYLPSPRQRFTSCSKASRLLRKGGILLVLTPDSKHDSANSKLVRNWRLALASLGFLLVLTEKLKHLRCLVFAKSNNPDIPKKWLSFQNIEIEPEDAIAIPQDRNPYENINNENFDNENKESIRSDSDNKFIAESFSHLSVEGDIFN